MTGLAGLLTENKRLRSRAVRELPASFALAYALRRVLFTDVDAEVRTAAARRLGDLARELSDISTQPIEHGDAPSHVRARRGVDGRTIEGWLVDAIGDRSPLVRDTLLRALARVGSSSSAPAVRVLVASDRLWWVRRTAVYTLAALTGAADVATFKAVLADPFWRVRHAAVKVLAVLGARDLDVRDEVIAAPPTPTLAFLRASWGPVAVEAPMRAATGSSALPPALLDADPAVVTARLAGARVADERNDARGAPTAERVSVAPLALVELLCDPHAPLRLLAAERLLGSGETDAYRAMLDWLEEPRIPHVADVVETLADRLGDPAIALAQHALERAELRPGAARWAIRWVVATKFDELYEPALVAARRDAKLRADAVRIATIDDLVAWAADASTASDSSARRAAIDELVAASEAAAPHVPSASSRTTRVRHGEHDPLVDTIAVELHARRSRAAHEALLALDTTHHAMAYTLELDAAARRELWDRVEPALDDPHHGPRAIAARWLTRAGRLSHAATERLAADPDPSVREALATAWRDDAASIDRLDARRTAPQDVARDDAPEHDAAHDGDARGNVARDDAPERDVAPDDARASHTLLARLVRDDDPWVARAALERLVDTRKHDTPCDVATVLYALASEDAWLRGKALELPIEDDRVLERAIVALADHDPGVQSAALDALEQVPDIDVRLAALAPAGELATRMIHAWLRGDMLPGRSEPHVELGEHDEPQLPARRTPAQVEHRPFGRAGFSVAPLAISGAFDLSPSALRVAADAGVNLWFWEPAYDSLTRFVRGGRDHVIAGSYHADARSIEADVDRALRLLSRDTLDVLLLFWSRSPARVDATAYATIEHLKRSGKVRALGFSTHHRTLARDAIEASPWDVVMIRHSAAHPGIETELLPAARERGTAIVTFSALCYGRMLSGATAPSAADCYRYSLSQPGVTACISAPRRRSEVSENAAVLAQSTLDEARLAALRLHGIGVRTENQRFNTLLRQPTRDAAEAARALLASELPPSDELAIDLPLPRPARTRPARTNLGKTRTRSRP